MRLTKMKPISYLKNNTAELVEKLRQEQTDIVITQNGVPVFVCVPVKSYESSRQAVALLHLLNMGQRDVQEDMVVDASVAMYRLEQSLFSEPPNKPD